MTPVRRLADVLELRRDHEGFLVDLWGVIHDGERLGEGVLDALVALAASGARVLFLSNSSRLGDLLTENLVAMGVPRAAFLGAVSSGDVTRAALARRDPAVFSGLPASPRVLHVGSPGFVPWLFELGFDFCEDAGEADLVIATGTVADEAALAALRERLAPLAARGTPLVCTNPDRVLPARGTLALAPGAVAHAYAELGGRTHLYGKPHAPIYREALARLAVAPERVVAIGDMIETDIRGARGAAVASVLVTTGVHAAELGDEPDEEALATTFTRHGAAPDAILARFGAPPVPEVRGA